MSKKKLECLTFIRTKDDDGNPITKGILPVFQTIGAACADVASPDAYTIAPGEVVKIPLNISFSIPDGYMIRMYPRSSLLVKKQLLSPVSIIDSDYYGIVSVPLYNCSNEPRCIAAGERIAQIELCEASIRTGDWYEEKKVRDQKGFGGTGTGAVVHATDESTSLHD